jgi:OmpA-OmpF porin, OOP family
MKRNSVAIGLVVLFGEIAQAADNGFYLGVAQTEPDADLSDAEEQFFDDGDNGFKLIGGLRPLDWLGVEMSYVEFGDVQQTRNMPDFSDFRFEQTGVDAFAVFFVDVALFDFFAKAGILKWDLEGSGNTLSGRTSSSADGEDLGWGVGAQARFGSFALRLEYERFDIEDDALVPEIVSLGFTWTFL